MYPFPKVELHLHIDGSVRPQTCHQLAKQQKLPLGELSLQQVRELMLDEYTDPDNPFRAFDTPLLIMQTPQALSRITKELLQDLQKEGIIYAELRFAPQFHLKNGLTQKSAIEAVLQGQKEAKQTGTAIESGILLCAMEWGPGEEYRNINEETIRLAAQYLDQGVVGIDLAGYEDHLSEYRYVFDLARQLGVPATCHAEDHVDQCIPFKTPRIGHGYQAARVPELSNYIIKNQILLEMCPKSSLVYQLPPNENHPLRTLYQAGARVCVNTDNRTVLNTNLNQEYDMCRKMGFTTKDLIKMNIYAIEGSFAPKHIKEKILSQLTPLLPPNK